MRPLGRPLFDITAYRGSDNWETFHYLANYSKVVGTSGQLNMSMCAWYYLDARTDTTNSLNLCTFYTYTNEIMKVILVGSNDGGYSRSTLCMDVWNMTSGNGRTLFDVQPTFPCWMFVALSAPTSAGNPAYGYYSLLNEDRWHVKASTSFTGPATKPDMALSMSGGNNSLRGFAHWRVFNWSLTLDEWKLEKWRFRPSGREYVYYPFGRYGKADLIGAKTVAWVSTNSPITLPGPITQHEMLARRRRRTPLYYRFAGPSADVSNSGWTRVP